MLKSSFLLIIASVVAIFFKQILAKGLHALVVLHNQVASWLGLIFSTNASGRIILSILSLLIIPVVVGLIVALIYWMIKRHAMPQVMTVVWVVWTILLVTMLAQIT